MKMNKQLIFMIMIKFLEIRMLKIKLKYKIKKYLELFVNNKSY